MSVKVFIVSLVFLFGCKEKADREVSVLQLKEMSELATVNYTITKVIKASDNNTWFKIGDRKILMSCVANVKAGIDLDKISKSNFSIDGKSISVMLPSPKLISISIPPESIKTEYEEVGVFRTKFTNKERDELAKQAEENIKKSLGSLGILSQAQVTTATFVTQFLKRLGYEEIHISFGGKTINSTMP